jgi:hypothetical protein
LAAYYRALSQLNQTRGIAEEEKKWRGRKQTFMAVKIAGWKSTV